MTFIPNEQLNGSVNIIARGGDVNNQPDLLTVNGIDMTSVLNRQGPSGQIYEFNVGNSGINNTQGVTWSRAASGGVNFCHIYGIRVAGDLLVDTNESLNIRVNQLYGNGLIGVPNATVDFTPGKYLFVPGQRVAPWVLYGNDPTSLIDHLRSK